MWNFRLVRLGGKPLRDYVESSLPTFARGCDRRRIIVVKDIAVVPQVINLFELRSIICVNLRFIII